MKDLKWLLIGAGDIATKRVAPALASVKGSRLFAVCARRTGPAEDLVAQYGAERVYHDYRQAIEESGADAVYIATPQSVHVEMAEAALAAGKHFLSEKPLGVSAEECRKLLKDAEARPELVCSCSNYRAFTNQFVEFGKIVDSGEFGRLLGGWAQDEERFFNPSKAPLLKRDGMTPLQVFGFYLLNLAQIVFGTPSEARMVSSSFNCDGFQPFDTEDVENVLLRYPDGRQFTIFLNMATLGPLRHTYEFYFERGRVQWPGCPPHFNVPIRKITDVGEMDVAESVTPEDTPGALPNWHVPMIADFVDAVQNGRNPVCTLERAVRTAEITEGLLENGYWTPTENGR